MEIEPIFRRLADSENWEVRERAASAGGEVLAGHHDSYHVLASWTRHASANVRRAVALAAMYASKTRNPDNAEPLLTDANPYVKRNLGPFARGSGLLRYYPTEILTRINEWSRHPEARARWNVAMVLTAAEEAKHRPRRSWRDWKTIPPRVYGVR